MRRFVQALSGFDVFPGLPVDVAAELRAVPDRYNLSVRQTAAVLFAEDDRWQLAPMAWGLVPSWEREPATKYSTQTARLDRAPTSRLFRRAWESRRCLVPINGYYKWDRTRKPHWPHFIQPVDGLPLYAAGLWERWRRDGDDDASEFLDSFALLTFPNPAIPPPLTADGPLFVPPDRLVDWLSSGGWWARRVASRAKERQPRLEAYPVARRVGNPTLDDYTLLEPADPAARDALAPEDDGYDVDDD
jgi:putative SOS response-associated peptidase YedK